MEFTVGQKALVGELGLTQGVIERKTTIPILSNLLLEAKGDRLAIAATDLELGIKTGCPAKVKKDGAGTVPARRLLEIVRMLPPDKDIRFKLLENHWFQITCEKSNFRLVGMAKDNFPVLPAFPHALVKIPGTVLATLIAKTIFSISTEESRYTLSGAKLILKPESMTMVATDGHRLAIVETDEKLEGLRGEQDALIPKKAMAELQRLLADAGEEAAVEFSRDENHLFFKIGDRLLLARMLTGQFPNYEAVLPRENNKIVQMDRGVIDLAVRRVALLADVRSHAIKFALSAEGVEVSSSSPDFGEAKESVEASYKGDAVTIGFNANYLLEFFSAAPEGKVSFEFKDEQSAGQLRPLGDERFHYRYVVMPMRI
jgi:DNA polymerase-3 subunit beta